jgi:DNA-binding protein HU-beta
MNKTELVDIIATEADLSKAAASRALDAALNAIASALKKEDNVALLGFGTFTVRERAAREGRNPRTGDIIKIKATKVPSFKAGRALKETVNNSEVAEVAEVE